MIIVPESGGKCNRETAVMGFFVELNLKPGGFPDVHVS
jgi:hypothetical protein